MLFAVSFRHDRPVAYLCAIGGGGLLLAALLRCHFLSLGSGVFVACCLLALAALSLLLLFRWGKLSSRGVLLCLLPVGLAVFLRCLCLDYTSNDYLVFLSDWAAFFRENGGWAALRLPKGNYNVPYLYFLAAISYFPVPDLYAIKLFSILFDVILAWGGMRLVHALTPERIGGPAAAFCVLLLLPTVILNGALWAQCDSIYAAFCIHALASALERRSAQSVLLVALAFSFKLQTVFLLPLWCALWLAGRIKFRHLLLFPAVSAAVCLPALLLGKPLGDILGIYLGQTTEYSNYLTLNAPSVYALLPFEITSNIPAAAHLGILSAFAAVGVILLLLFFRRHKITDQALFLTALFFAVGIPFLLPHMHDRYFFLADVLTLCWSCFRPRRIVFTAAVQIASLGAYYAYLSMHYLFPMAWGALLLLAVLPAVLYFLIRELAAYQSSFP